MVCHVDFYASFAAMMGQALSADAAPDSENVLDALLGRSAEGRGELVVEGMQARTVMRNGNWSYIPANDGPAISPTTGIETGHAPAEQLYDLSQDIGQIRNVADEHPDVLQKLTARLQEIRGGAMTRGA
jgi:arylsulfatase A-like enzyme